MNPIKFILFIALMSFFSCNDAEDINTKNVNNEATIRSGEENVSCSSCEGINNIQLVKTSPTDVNGCCEFTLTWHRTEGCHLVLLRQEIYVNDSLIGRISNFPSNSYVIPVCSPDTEVKILGLDPATGLYTSECFRQNVSCKTCCDGITVTENIIENKNFCCKKEIIFQNFGSCDASITREGQPGSTLPIPLPANGGYYKVIVNICANDIPYDYVVKVRPGIECKRHKVIPCQIPVLTCCDFVNYDIRNINNENGCCVSEITIINNSDCVFYLYDEITHNLEATLPEHSTVVLTKTACNNPNNEGPQNLFYIADEDGVRCKSFSLNSTCNFDCQCEGSNFESTFRFNEDGCCYYYIEPTSTTDCPMFIFNEAGEILIAHGSNGGGITIPICEDTRLYFGPNINEKDACFSTTLTCK